MPYLTRKIILLIVSSVLVFSTGIGRADDTEIYFSSASAAESVLRPNVLFILDTSGSMTLPADSGESRIDELKQAMETVLENARKKAGPRQGFGQFSQSESPVARNHQGRAKENPVGGAGGTVL